MNNNPLWFEAEVRIMSDLRVYPSPVNSKKERKEGRVERLLGGYRGRIGEDGSKYSLGGPEKGARCLKSKQVQLGLLLGQPRDRHRNELESE